MSNTKNPQSQPSKTNVWTEQPSPHIKWLREAAQVLHGEQRTALARTCEQAARELEAIQEHRKALMQAHEISANLPDSLWLVAPCERGPGWNSYLGKVFGEKQDALDYCAEDERLVEVKVKLSAEKEAQG